TAGRGHRRRSPARPSWEVPCSNTGRCAWFLPTPFRASVAYPIRLETPLANKPTWRTVWRPFREPFFAACGFALALAARANPQARKSGGFRFILPGFSIRGIPARGPSQMRSRPMPKLEMIKDGHLGGYIRGGDPGTWCPNLWKWAVQHFDVHVVLDVG